MIVRTQWYKLSVFLVLTTFLTFAQAGNIRLPSLGGDASTTLVSPEEERRIGIQFMRALREEAQLVDHPEINYYLETLGQKLAAQGTGRSFEFFAIYNPSINAFAGPAGKIGIHSGLISKAKSEGELAAVLAHEIAHVTQHHLLRMLADQQQLTLPSIAAAFATIAAAAYNPQAGQAVAATTTGLALQHRLNFSRHHEQEADRIGMQFLTDAGYEPKQMLHFFERLQQETRSYGTKIPEYLRTHPLTMSRISDIANRVEQKNAEVKRSSRTFETDNREFRRIQQMLTVQYTANPQELLRSYQAALKINPKNSALRFGYGLALLKAEKPQQALKQLELLLEKDPYQTTLSIAVARAEFASQQPDTALERLQELHELYPGHTALTLRLAELLIQDRKAEKAAKLLEKATERNSSVPALFQKLSDASVRADQRTAAHLAQAEYLFLMGETEAAIRQLDYAERTARREQPGFFILSKIDGRRKVFDRQLMLEKED